jgi:hypothetical protein
MIRILNGHYDPGAALLVDRGAGQCGRQSAARRLHRGRHEYVRFFNRPNPKPTGRMTAVDLVKFCRREPDPNARLKIAAPARRHGRNRTRLRRYTADESGFDTMSR